MSENGDTDDSEDSELEYEALEKATVAFTPDEDPRQEDDEETEEE